jgi:hypothetical protein
MKKAVLAFLLGLSLIGLGIALATEREISCEIGGPALLPGQTCTNAQRPGRTPIVNTYEEQREGNRRSGYVAIGFGVLFLVLGASLVLPRKFPTPPPKRNTA